MRRIIAVISALTLFFSYVPVVQAAVVSPGEVEAGVYDFDGVDDYVSFPSVDFTGIFNIAFNAEADTVGATQTLLGGTSTDHFDIQSGGLVRARIDSTFYDTSYTAVAGEKLFIEWDRDGANSMTVKVNGTQVLEQTVSGTLTLAAFGHRNGSVQHFDGSMWDIQIDGHAHFKTDEGDGNIAFDSSGNENHGTITNATLSTFHATDSTIPYVWRNEVGYSDGYNILPADNTFYDNDQVSYWSTTRSTLSHDSGGYMSVTNTDSLTFGFYKSGIISSGTTYRVYFRARSDDTTAAFQSIGDNASLGTVVSNPNISSSWQDYEFEITPTQTIMRFYIGTSSSGDVFDIDDIYIIDTTSGSVPRDESNTTKDVLGNDLQYFGWSAYQADLEQSYYRWYSDTDNLTPTDPWDSLYQDVGENQAISSPVIRPALGEELRLRMLVRTIGDALPANQEAFTLQYGERSTSCGAITGWNDIDDSGATGGGVVWRGGTSPNTHGEFLISNLISLGDVYGNYSKDNPSAVTPYATTAGEYIEFDWHLDPYAAAADTAYCFRMIRDNGLEFDTYTYYPTITVSGERPRTGDWRWYEGDDLEPNEGSGTGLASQNVTPINLGQDEHVELRVAVHETANITGSNNNFKLQFSETADFSGTVADVSDEGSCVETSYWCYKTTVTGEQVITNQVLTSTNISGVYAEQSISAVTQNLTANDVTEFAFSLRHANARANTTYYFRLYDLVNNAEVPLHTGASYPSISTDGAFVTFSINGVSSGASVEGETTDVTTTSSTIPFGVIIPGTPVDAAHQLTLVTNASEGYRVYARHNMMPTSASGDQLQPITSTYAAPADWNTSCPFTSVSCVGYRTSDDLLTTGAQFAPAGVFAPIETTMREIGYSTLPTTGDTLDILYRAEVSQTQPAGIYTGDVSYFVVPVY